MQGNMNVNSSRFERTVRYSRLRVSLPLLRGLNCPCHVLTPASAETSCSSTDGRGMGRGGEPVQITGARGPIMLLMFLSFSVVSLFAHCTN